MVETLQSRDVSAMVGASSSVLSARPRALSRWEDFLLVASCLDMTDEMLDLEFDFVGLVVDREQSNVATDDVSDEGAICSLVSIHELKYLSTFGTDLAKRLDPSHIVKQF